MRAPNPVFLDDAASVVDPSRRPAPVAGFRPVDYVVAGGVAVAALVVYWFTLAPTVSGDDSGELITAAHFLGIPHPPGYPLWCLLGKAFTVLVPVGDIAWRVNFMSAFLGAMTVSATYLLSLSVTHSRPASVTAALVLAFSREFWKQSVIAEVYTLNALLIAVCLLLLLAWHEHRRTRFLCLFGLTYGLSLCNHPTPQLLGPGFLIFLLLVDRRPWQRWRAYFGALTLASLALTIWLYLPIRSRANPPIDWGNPEDWNSFWAVVTRKVYTLGLSENPRSLGSFMRQTWAFLKLYGQEFTPWFAWLPCVGAVVLWRRNRFQAGLLVGMFFLIVFGFIAILNFYPDRRSLWANNVFWIPAYLIAAVLLGVAVDAIARTRLRGRSMVVPAAIVAAACVAAPLTANYPRNDKSEYFFARDYGLNILRSMEHGAIYLPSSDHATFTVLYLQAVEGVRPDVVFGSAFEGRDEGLYRDMPQDLRDLARGATDEEAINLVDEWIVSRASAPVYFTKRRSFQLLKDWKTVSAGLVYKAVPSEAGLLEDDPWAEYSWHTLDPEDARGDLTAEVILADCHLSRAAYLLERGETGEALAAMDQAYFVGGELRSVLNNLGNACSRAGLHGQAQRYFSRLLELFPDDPMGLYNLGVAHLRMGAYREAEAYFEKSVALRPDPDTGRLLAVCLTEQGKIDQALEQYRRVVEQKPGDAGLYREIGLIYLEQKHDPRQARQLFERSLSLNPNQPELVELLRNL